MAGKQTGNSQQFNSLQAGLLPTHEANNPASQRYQHGLQESVGVKVISGRVTHMPSPSAPETHKLPLDFVPYKDGSYYKRNTAGSSGESLTTTIPTDFTNVSIQPLSLSDRIKSKMSSGDFLARPSTNDNTGKYESGGWQSFDKPSDYTEASCKVFATGEKIAVGGNLKFVRAVSFSDDSGLRWGMVGRKKASKRVKYRNGFFAKEYDLSIDETSDQYTVVNGNGSKSSAWSVYSYPIMVDIVKGTIEVHPIIRTLKAGQLLEATADIYLVGEIKMFKSSVAASDLFKNPRSYSQAFTSKLGNTSASVSWDASKQSDKQIEDEVDTIYVLRWGTGDTGLGTSDTPIQTLGAEIDSNAFGFPANAVSSTATNNMFDFAFMRNKVHHKRRIGIANFIPSSAITGFDKPSCVGFSKIDAGNDRGQTTVLSSAPTAPFVAFLDGDAQWVEIGYQGIFAGSSNGEFIISGDTDATSFTVNRISSIGSIAPRDRNYCDNSCQLNGVIYFITKTGIASLTFSNESQSYIPRTVNIVDYANSSPVSIASSKMNGSIIVTCADGSIISVFQETGSASMVNVPMPDGYDLVGVRTEDGEPLFVALSNATYKSIKFSETQVSDSTFMTTRFFAGPEKISKINKVYLFLSNSFGGRVRAEGQESWTEIGYTAQEIADWTSGKSFTGTKEVFIGDVAGDHGSGRAIEVNFTSSEPMNIVGISVGGDS